MPLWLIPPKEIPADLDATIKMHSAREFREDPERYAQSAAHALARHFKNVLFPTVAHTLRQLKVASILAGKSHLIDNDELIAVMDRAFASVQDAVEATTSWMADLADEENFAAVFGDIMKKNPQEEDDE